MAVTGMPAGRLLPNLPSSQTSDLATQTNELGDVVRETGRIPATSLAGRQYHQLLQSILSILSHPIFKQLMQAGQPQKLPMPAKQDFHVPTGSVPLERYPLPQTQPRPTTRQGQ